jgi:hypothetical protein
MTRDEGWWLNTNRYGGVHRAPGATAAEARAFTRAAIAESFMAGGMTKTAARKAASSYDVRTVAGPAPYADVVAANDAWEALDHGPAKDLALRTGHRRVAYSLAHRVDTDEQEAAEAN